MKYRFLLIVVALMSFPFLAFAGGNKVSPAYSLFQRLWCLQKEGIMLGHQDDTFYGHDWHDESGRSDVLETAGDYPAVMGFDLGGLEIGDSKDLDHVPFVDIHREIIAQHNRGGIVTLSWHCRNLINGKTSWDPEGGELDKLLSASGIGRLDSAILSVATFISSLKTDNGPVPVILRTWHEMSGDWFWWGGKNTTPETYKRFYRYTHDKLDSLCPGQIVWAFSPNFGVKSMDEYYPGDAYVDVVGVDLYDFNNDAPTYARNVKAGLDMVTAFAVKHHKIAAFTETGCQQLKQSKWFTETLGPSIKDYPLSYVLIWRNAWDNPKELYMSYKGHATESDFKKWTKQKCVLLVKDIKNYK